MNSIIAFLDLGNLTSFGDNPISVISDVLTSTYGTIGYIAIMFALMAIVYVHTRNVFMMGVFVIIYGVVADVLYDPSFILIINMLGISLIMGHIFYEAYLKGE